MTSTQRIIKYCALGFAFFLIFNILYGLLFGISSLGMIFSDDEVDTYRNINFNGDLNVVDINLLATNLIIKNGSVLKAETNNKYINIDQDGNRLIINERKHNKNMNNNDLIVYIPYNLNLDGLSISTGAGTIDAAYINAKKAIFNFGAGDVNFTELNISKEADIEGGVGRITIKGGQINNLDLSIGVGESNISSDLIGETDIKTGVGSLNLNLLGNKDSYKIHTDKGMGTISIEDNIVVDDTTYGKGRNEIDIEGGIGSINVNFVVSNQ